MTWGDDVEIDNDFESIEYATRVLRRQLIMTYLAEPGGIAEQLGRTKRIRVGWVMGALPDETPPP